MLSGGVMKYVFPQRLCGACLVVLILSLIIPLLCSAQAATRQNPELSNIRSLIEEGKFDTAEKRIHLLLSRQPRSAQAFDLLGLVYLRQERFADAEDAAHEALAIKPKFVDALRHLGNAFVGEDETNKAETCFRQAL